MSMKPNIRTLGFACLAALFIVPFQNCAPASSSGSASGSKAAALNRGAVEFRLPSGKFN